MLRRRCYYSCSTKRNKLPKKTETKLKTTTTVTTTTSNGTTSSAPIYSNHWGVLNQRYAILNDMNLSELAGNLSSILVLLAYSMTDMLALRATSVAATLLSILFQYYRATPLWIPIRWNCVLLLINVTMVSKLYLERRRANQMDDTMETIYQDGQFERRGFSRVEFLRLYERAHVVKLPPGHVLVRQGQRKDGLYFLLDGQVKISRSNITVARLGKYKFVGEISLLGRIEHDIETGASADVAVASSSRGATFLKWDMETLIPFLNEDRQVFNALARYLNYDLTAKLLREGVIQRADTAQINRPAPSKTPETPTAKQKTIINDNQNKNPDKENKQ